MKTIRIITLLAFASLLMSSSCTTDEQDVLCDCKEIRHTLPPGATTYIYHSTVDMPELDCDDENLNTHFNGFFHIRIECE